MSRPNVTDSTINGLAFARACVLDQRAASHKRGDHSWDSRYAAAFDSIDSITSAHQKATKTATKKAAKKR